MVMENFALRRWNASDSPFSSQRWKSRKGMLVFDKGCWNLTGKTRMAQALALALFPVLELCTDFRQHFLQRTMRVGIKTPLG